jgi:hypothetical protein
MSGWGHGRNFATELSISPSGTDQTCQSQLRAVAEDGERSSTSVGDARRSPSVANEVVPGTKLGETRKAHPTADDPEQEAEHAMEKACEANGEGPSAHGPSDDAVNDTDERYGHDESPAEHLVNGGCQASAKCS